MAQRELRSRGAVAPLGGRAFEILEILVQADGALVSKYDLIDRLWPGAAVLENTLHAQISAIRRALGSERDLLKNVAGRGYRLLGGWKEVTVSSSSTVTNLVHTYPDHRLPDGQRQKPLSRTNLPQPLSELIGRDAELREIAAISSQHRLVTLTGTGGIGKTRLAFDVALHGQSKFSDGVWVAEFATLSDPTLVPITVATALKIEPVYDNASPQAIATALASKQVMLVLDNCEHVIDAAARMAELLLRANPEIRIIATSREALRIEGEWIYRVPPLAAPIEETFEVNEQLKYGAVRLFYDRARSSAASFVHDAHSALLIANICRRLDGIPLAIELAAARVGSLGIEGVASGLDDLFQLLSKGRRTALPRHQTLRETLNWSHDLLTASEKALLRRMAIFVGGFTLTDAIAIGTNDKLSTIDVVEGLANLVEKSLLVIDTAGALPLHRFLETTRAYAREHLEHAGEVDATARHHAQRYLHMVSAMVGDSPTNAPGIDVVDNVRSALDWAFSPRGDVSIGLELTAAVAPIWIRLSLVEECRRWTESALSARCGRQPSKSCVLKCSCSSRLRRVSSSSEVGRRRRSRLATKRSELRSALVMSSSN